MPRGPRPKPTLADTARGHHPTEEDRSPPPEVQADPRAVEAWDATLDALDAVGLFHRADRAIVARYAVLTGHYHACLEDLRETGPFMETKTGYRAPSPAATNLLKLADKLAAIEAALGLTPRSRANMKVQPASLSDEEERLLRTFIAPPAGGNW
mgnify:CR=1 FL=1